MSEQKVPVEETKLVSLMDDLAVQQAAVLITVIVLVAVVVICSFGLQLSL